MCRILWLCSFFAIERSQKRDRFLDAQRRVVTRRWQIGVVRKRGPCLDRLPRVAISGIAVSSVTLIVLIAEVHRAISRELWCSQGQLYLVVVDCIMPDTMGNPQVSQRFLTSLPHGGVRSQAADPPLGQRARLDLGLLDRADSCRRLGRPVFLHMEGSAAGLSPGLGQWRTGGLSGVSPIADPSKFSDLPARYGGYSLYLALSQVKGPPITWVAVHRKHHEFADKEG